MEHTLYTAFWNWDRDLGLDPSPYTLAIWIFLRLLGLIYIAAYLPFLFQILGLIGKDGIRPVKHFLNVVYERFGTRGFYYYPTLLWLNASDWALLALIWSGVILGGLLVLGIYPALVLLLLYVVHLSLTTAGQEFLSFGWETFLMEITLGSCFLVATEPYNSFAWIGLNVLLLRFHVQAGISKLKSQDENWRNLTAISYHYQTQPLPNTTAWYFHKFPMWFHRFSVLLMFFVELVIPFLIFAPPEIRLLVFILLVGLQGSIWLTGNLSYLNHLTVVFCLILINNRYLEPFFGPVTLGESSSAVWQGLVSVFGVGFLFLQVINFWQTFFPNRIFQRILYEVQPFHVSYPHGIFAIMTTKRYEIIVEGSRDGKEWKEYGFYFKPGDVARRPVRNSPWQPRLDWQAWFLPFAPYHSQWWFQQFLMKLLQGSPAVVRLLKENPFKDKPPQYVRAMIYDYEFTTYAEKRKTGHWWKRRLLGVYAPSIRLMTAEERKLKYET